MTQHSERRQTNWNVDYEAVDPIRIRDPVAEVLAVLDPKESLVIEYRDIVNFLEECSFLLVRGVPPKTE